MNDFDLLELMNGELMFSTTFEVHKHTDTLIVTDDVVINESTTIVESLSFGDRSLDVDDILEDFNEDLSWLL